MSETPEDDNEEFVLPVQDVVIKFDGVQVAPEQLESMLWELRENLSKAGEPSWRTEIIVLAGPVYEGE